MTADPTRTRCAGLAEPGGLDVNLDGNTRYRHFALLFGLTISQLQLAEIKEI